MWDKPNYWINGVPQFEQRCVKVRDTRSLDATQPFLHHVVFLSSLFLRVHSQALLLSRGREEMASTIDSDEFSGDKRRVVGC